MSCPACHPSSVCLALPAIRPIALLIDPPSELHCPLPHSGQLYVALSRVGRFENLRVLALPPDSEKAREFIKSTPGVYAMNVVYKEVFADKEEDEDK